MDGFLKSALSAQLCARTNPLRRSRGSQTPQRVVPGRLHCRQLSQGFSQMALASQRLLISFLPSLYVLGFGLESTAWAGLPQSSRLCPQGPAAPARRRGSVGQREGRGRGGRRTGLAAAERAHGLAGCSDRELPSTGRNRFLSLNKYPKPGLFRKNCSASGSLRGLIQSYRSVALLQCLQSNFFSIYGSSPT